MLRPRWSRDLTIWLDLITAIGDGVRRHPTAASFAGGSLVGTFIGVVAYRLIM